MPWEQDCVFSCENWIAVANASPTRNKKKKKKKNRSVKKAKKLRNSLDFIEMAISLLLQWTVAPSSHTQGRKKERVSVGTSSMELLVY